MQQKAYDYIKQNILDGTWENEVRLVEQDIVNSLSISRTPIREAISSLTAEGYLEKETNRGVIVKKQVISPKEFIERSQLLEMLLSSYFFQLQAKYLMIDTEELLKTLNKMEHDLKTNSHKITLDPLLTCLLEKMENDVMKQLIIKNFNQLQYVTFPHTENRFFYQEIVLSMNAIHQHLVDKSYELCRKDVRVLFNRLNLEVIDQQIEEKR